MTPFTQPTFKNCKFSELPSAVVTTLKHDNNNWEFFFTPDGSQAITSNCLKTTIWNSETGKKVKEFNMYFLYPNFSPNNTIMTAKKYFFKIFRSI